MARDKRAVLYRTVLRYDACPIGERAKWQLESNGFEVDDRVLRSATELNAFEDEHGVYTTPQVFIDGRRIGDPDELEGYLRRA